MAFFLFMKIIIENFQDNSRNAIRRCGYAEIHDRLTGKTSYVRRLSWNFYPRFHAYLESNGEHMVIDIHLDQKKPSYYGSSAHSGEYSGEAVEKEVERVKSLLASQ